MEYCTNVDSHMVLHNNTPEMNVKKSKYFEKEIIKVT